MLQNELLLKSKNQEVVNPSEQLLVALPNHSHGPKRNSGIHRSQKVTGSLLEPSKPNPHNIHEKLYNDKERYFQRKHSQKNSKVE